MYSREYPREQSRGAVKAFEDAYAKEEFLRRSANMGMDSPGCTAVSKERPDDCGTNSENGAALQQDCEKALCTEKDTAKHKGGLAGWFKDTDSGDLILLLLILFFLFDSDRENDSLIPVLLAVLLLF